MDVEGAILRHVPHHLGQHAEGNDHLEVGLIATQLLHEGGILHLLRLQHGQLMFQGVFFHFRGLYLRLMTTHGLVGLCDHCHDIVLILYQRL